MPPFLVAEGTRSLDSWNQRRRVLGAQTPGFKGTGGWHGDWEQ